MVRNARRLRAVACPWRLLVMLKTRLLVLQWRILGLNQGKPSDHRPKIIPTRAKHLRDVNQEEAEKRDHQPEVFAARHWIAPQQSGEPRQLRWLVDREAGDHAAHSH